MMNFITEYFDPIMRISLVLGVIGILFLGGYLGNKAARKAEQQAIREGRLRRISRAQYNAAFGIKPKLEIIKNDNSS